MQHSQGNCSCIHIRYKIFSLSCSMVCAGGLLNTYSSNIPTHKKISCRSDDFVGHGMSPYLEVWWSGNTHLTAFSCATGCSMCDLTRLDWFQVSPLFEETKICWSFGNITLMWQQQNFHYRPERSIDWLLPKTLLHTIQWC